MLARSGSLLAARHTALLAIVTLFVGTRALAMHASRAPQATPSQTIQQANALLASNRLTSDEGNWDQVPWVQDLDEARALSLKSKRPVLLFAMHGMIDGRC